MGVFAKRLRAAMLLGCAGVAMAGCQGAGGSASASLNIAATSAKIDAPGVPIAFEGIEGAPPEVKTELAGAMAAEAAARQVEIVAAPAARFRVKGYLATSEGEDGATTLSFVWDVFDAAKQRSRRIEGTRLAKGAAAADPWSAVDSATLGHVAAQSMNEIAGFLAAGGAEALPAPTTVAGLAPR